MSVSDDAVYAKVKSEALDWKDDTAVNEPS
jgi:hypothetical protein